MSIYVNYYLVYCHHVTLRLVIGICMYMNMTIYIYIYIYVFAVGRKIYIYIYVGRKTNRAEQRCHYFKICILTMHGTLHCSTNLFQLLVFPNNGQEALLTSFSCKSFTFLVGMIAHDLKCVFFLRTLILFESSMLEFEQY